MEGMKKGAAARQDDRAKRAQGVLGTSLPHYTPAQWIVLVSMFVIPCALMCVLEAML